MADGEDLIEGTRVAVPAEPASSLYLLGTVVKPPAAAVVDMDGLTPADDYVVVKFDDTDHDTITIGVIKRVVPGGLKAVAPENIKLAGEIYVDARGVGMEPMTYSQALEIVHELAAGHQMSEKDVPRGETELLKTIRWQQDALDTMEDTIVNHSENIDDSWKPQIAYQGFPENIVGCNRDLDPDKDLVAAIRICLELGETNIPDPRKSDPEEADMIDRANQACNIVEDFIGFHGDDLRSKITLVPNPS